jgi:hypothetical protein
VSLGFYGLDFRLTDRVCAIVLINSKPFVLRDSAAAKTMLSLSDRAENLEQIELKLKEDILREARRLVVIPISWLQN